MGVLPARRGGSEALTQSDAELAAVAQAAVARRLEAIEDQQRAMLSLLRQLVELVARMAGKPMRDKP